MFLIVSYFDYVFLNRIGFAFGQLKKRWGLWSRFLILRSQCTWLLMDILVFVYSTFLGRLVVQVSCTQEYIICFIRIFGKLTFFLRLCFESWKTSKKRKAKRKKKSMIIKKLVWASKFSLIVLHFYSPLRRERKINACIIFRLDSDHVKFAGKENKEDKCKERKSEGN